MQVSYDKLWKMLIDKKMNRSELKDASGISFNVIAKLGRNEFVSMESLCRICVTLGCDFGDIVELKKTGRRDERKNCCPCAVLGAQKNRSAPKTTVHAAQG